MRVLVACEESQRVCIAFRDRGNEAYSCDIEACSGGHKEWHIQHDVIPLLNGNEDFTTADGTSHRINGKWDLIIAHPPCTYLTVAGNSWFNEERYGEKATKRKRNRQEAIDFFMKFVNAGCEQIVIENPIGIMSSVYRKPDQIIQPYWFGDPARKATCLWLKGLQPLQPTKIVEPEVIRYKNGKTDDPWHYNTLSLPPKERARERSKTFQGVAKAMAEQWGREKTYYEQLSFNFGEE